MNLLGLISDKEYLMDSNQLTGSFLVEATSKLGVLAVELLVGRFCCYFTGTSCRVTNQSKLSKNEQINR